MSPILAGTGIAVGVQHGALVEYAVTPNPQALFFEFNPSSISRTRSITVNTGGSKASRGGYDFRNPKETPRASQGVTVNAESFSITILLDATDRMNNGDPIATVQGVLPEIDTLRCMIEPKSQTPDGMQILSSLEQASRRPFFTHETASVLLFVWGVHVLPVFLTQVQVTEKEFLPSLNPYRAEAALTMQVIESRNPFYQIEIYRQFINSVLNKSSGHVSSLIGVL